MNVLHVVFWAFAMNCENQELVLFKFHKFPSFVNIINSEWNKIVDGN